jgi:putative glutamine amidotransferase
MTRPIILLPGASHPDHGPRVFANLAYVRAIEDAGGLVWITGRPEAESELMQLMEHADALLLMGGSDVAPECYKKNMCKHVQDPDPRRDQLELTLLSRARDKRIPILGICRGLQTMNIGYGGSLYRDIADEFNTHIPHDGHEYPRNHYSHDVSIAPSTLFARLASHAQIPVNSLHHQGIHTLGHGLIASAHAPDGLIEAIEDPTLPFALGVQWHPEELDDSTSREIFRAFIEAAKNRQ